MVKRIKKIDLAQFCANSYIEVYPMTPKQLIDHQMAIQKLLKQDKPVEIVEASMKAIKEAFASGKWDGEDLTIDDLDQFDIEMVKYVTKWITGQGEVNL